MNPNASRGLSSIDGNRAEFPAAFRLERFEMTNSRGQTREISKIVKEFSIYEDIFSPIHELKATIRDDINFFEGFGISGHETISIRITRQNSDFAASLPIDLKFSVVEYPDFTREENAFHVQYYTLHAVSDFAYVSRLKKISRSVSGNSLDIAKGILINDLNIPESEVNTVGSCVSQFRSVLATQQPLSAVAKLVKKSYDASGSPFLIFGRASTGKIILAPYALLIAQKAYGTYRYDYTLDSTSQTAASYAENAMKVLDIQSNLKLNKLDQANGGGFASRTNFLDLGTKTYYTHEFTSEEKTPSYRVNRENALPLNRISSAHINEVMVNSKAFGDGIKNQTSGGHNRAIYSAQSMLSNAEAYTHEILLWGNFELNPGKVIDLQIPRAASPDTVKSLFGLSDSVDSSLSGKYLISSSTHTFKEGEYKVSLRVIRN